MKISDIKLKIGEDESLVKQKALKKAGLKSAPYFRLLKKSLDARDKGDIFYTYSVELSDTPFEDAQEEIGLYSYPSKPVVIVGFGPAGLFCALSLARCGFNPIVLERGSNVDERKAKTEKFFSKAVLDPECNVQYGEGGAGTFSDGKLNTGVKSEYKQYVLSELIRHGAPECIAYLSKPHVGSDILPTVVKSIREEIIALGGKVLFDTRLSDLRIENGKITEIEYTDKKGKSRMEISELIVAIGHSSRDTYAMFFDKGVVMEQKDCAIGLRVEHLAQDINMAQYGKNIGVTADYKLTANVNNRGVFSFCMCPGGVVVPSSSEEGGVVTNGMSEFKRDKTNSNSAIVCQVRASDYGGGIMDGIDFVRGLEQRAFVMGGRNYCAPVQNVTDFLRDRKSSRFDRVRPTYSIGTEFCRMDDVLPPFIISSIRGAFSQFDRKIKGFASSGVLTAVESRTSSPVRIVRGEKLNGIGIENMYPAGEVGYAGGIMSAALDGLKIANAIKQRYIK
ncbi:MAG: hypothetical protein J6C23_05530 [Clostridia bacterium]|nr:hypothetical protein [Clostridia bacterium]